MRTRQKLTAVGAVALASSAIGGGAVATSHAMADSTTPVKGTMTVISMTSSDGAIKCVFDNIDLPTLAIGGGQETSSGPINVIGNGPVDANGKPIAGAVVVSSDSGIPPNGATPTGGPTLVTGGFISGTDQASTGEAGTASGGAGETTQSGPVLSGPLPGAPIAIDSTNARTGTAEECAALKPTTAGLPAPSAP